MLGYLNTSRVSKECNYLARKAWIYSQLHWHSNVVCKSCDQYFIMLRELIKGFPFVFLCSGWVGGFGQYAKQHVSPSLPLAQYPSNLGFVRLWSDHSASLPEIETAQEEVACERNSCHTTLSQAEQSGEVLKWQNMEDNDAFMEAVPILQVLLLQNNPKVWIYAFYFFNTARVESYEQPTDIKLR